jgi:hypothetical protein
MYTKQAVQNKLSQLTSLVKQVEYMIKRNDGHQAIEQLSNITEKLEDIQTLINRETQS